MILAKRAMARTGDDVVMPETLLTIQMDWETYQRESAAYFADAPGPGPQEVFQAKYVADTLDGAPIPPAQVFAAGYMARLRRIVFGAKSRKVDLGRSERFFKGASREAIMHRDRCCQQDGCDMPGRWCDVDHIREWHEGGQTNPENGQLLCRYHHVRKSKPTPKPDRSTTRAPIEQEEKAA